MRPTVKRVAAGLVSAAAVTAAFGLAATPPPVDPASSGGPASLVIQLGPEESIDGLTAAGTYAAARLDC